MDVPDHLLKAVSKVLGADVRLVGPTARGESGTTLDVEVGGAPAILKFAPDLPGSLENQQRLVRLVDSLRNRGYPAPEYLGVGSAYQVAFTVQRRLPGRTLEPGPGQPVDPDLLHKVLPEVLAAVELQREAGDLTEPPWPGWLLKTIYSGGDGYCLHHTMRRRPETASILERVVRVGVENARDRVRSSDIVHFDLNPANILHDDGRLSGIVDWNVPFDGAAQGDRGFDLATLLFYTYDIEASRNRLWEEARAVSGPKWTAVYLAHLVLRQVEWTVRHSPESAEEARFMSIAAMVLDDCEQVQM